MSNDTMVKTRLNASVARGALSSTLPETKTSAAPSPLAQVLSLPLSLTHTRCRASLRAHAVVYGPMRPLHLVKVYTEELCNPPSWAKRETTSIPPTAYEMIVVHSAKQRSADHSLSPPYHRDHSHSGFALITLNKQPLHRIGTAGPIRRVTPTAC